PAAGDRRQAKDQVQAIARHRDVVNISRASRHMQRGRVVGSVVGGLLTGQLLSRTVSGVLGANLGWRAIYFIAAAALSILGVVLWRFLPRTAAGEKMRYSALLLSMASLIRHQPVLRESCVFGSMTFAAFAAFWMTLAFHLESPALGHGSDVAGLMGLLALVGALAAGSVGRLTDRFSARTIVGLFLVLTLGSFGWLYFTGLSLLGLGIGVVLMDLGVQAVHVGSQSRVYSLIPEARNRLGTIYIVTYFAGGAVGSAAGVWGWTHYGWLGVCGSGAAFALTATLWFIVGRRRQPK
ncbi:MAG: MFS transporter, partial [Novipirellula sp. JB048]